MQFNFVVGKFINSPHPERRTSADAQLLYIAFTSVVRDAKEKKLNGIIGTSVGELAENMALRMKSEKRWNWELTNLGTESVWKAATPLSREEFRELLSLLPSDL